VLVSASLRIDILHKPDLNGDTRFTLVVPNVFPYFNPVLERKQPPRFLVEPEPLNPGVPAVVGPGGNALRILLPASNRFVKKYHDDDEEGE
jgi:hypothetical protein